MERREFAGGVQTTFTANTVSNVATSFDVISASSFPSGGTNPFAIVVSRGETEEEKMLVSHRIEETFFISIRGYDDTEPQNHAEGAVIDHILDSTTIQSMNTYTYDTAILNWMGI